MQHSKYEVSGLIAAAIEAAFVIRQSPRLAGESRARPDAASGATQFMANRALHLLAEAIAEMTAPPMQPCYTLSVTLDGQLYLHDMRLVVLLYSCGRTA